MLFDARAAKQLKPGAHIVVQGCPGLRLEAGLSVKSWLYRYRSMVDGKLRQVTLGQFPAMGLPAAVAEWERKRQERKTGADPALEKKAQRAEVKKARVLEREGKYNVRRVVLDYLDGYIDVHRDAKNAKALRARLLNAIGPIQEKEPHEVSRADAFDLIQGLADKPVLATSVRRELGGAWEHGQDAGKLPGEVPNWWRQVMRRKLPSKGAVREGKHKGTDKRVLTGQEVGTLVIQDLPKVPQQVQDVMILYLWALARGGEFCALHARHISLEKDGVMWCTLPKSATKNRKREAAGDFRFPIVGRARAVVERRLAANPGGWLFPGKTDTGHVAQAAIASQVHFVQPYSKSRPKVKRTRLVVTHWSPHDLRRTGRTMLAQLGCPDAVGEACLGHVTGGVAGVYNRHSYDAEKLHWLQILDQHLEQQIQAVGVSLKPEYEGHV